MATAARASASAIARARATRGRRLARARARGSNEDAIDALRELAGDAWSVNRYESKRKEHRTTELGDIVDESASRDNIAEHPGWTAAAKLRLCAEAVADELEMREDEVGERLGTLFALVPGLERRVGEVLTADIVRLAASVEDVAMKIIRMRDLLPEANLAKMLSTRPNLLLESDEEIARKVGELRVSCPRLRWDAILSDYPELWEVRDMRGHVELLREKLDIQDDEGMTRLLSQKPLLLLSVQSRNDMISYDHGSWAQVQATVNGDRFSDGW